MKGKWKFHDSFQRSSSVDAAVMTEVQNDKVIQYLRLSAYTAIHKWYSALQSDRWNFKMKVGLTYNLYI